MATPETFGNRNHFEGDGCDKNSIRHSMALSGADLQGRLFRKPSMGTCRVCGDPVMEEEFDCGKHGASK